MELVSGLPFIGYTKSPIIKKNTQNTGIQLLEAISIAVYNIL